jgi:hypothetical protein
MDMPFVDSKDTADLRRSIETAIAKYPSAEARNGDYQETNIPYARTEVNMVPPIGRRHHSLWNTRADIQQTMRLHLHRRYEQR